MNREARMTRVRIRHCELLARGYQPRVYRLSHSSSLGAQSGTLLLLAAKPRVDSMDRARGRLDACAYDCVWQGSLHGARPRCLAFFKALQRRSVPQWTEPTPRSESK